MGLCCLGCYLCVGAISLFRFCILHDVGAGFVWGGVGFGCDLFLFLFLVLVLSISFGVGGVLIGVCGWVLVVRLNEFEFSILLYVKWLVWWFVFCCFVWVGSCGLCSVWGWCWEFGGGFGFGCLLV